MSRTHFGVEPIFLRLIREFIYKMIYEKKKENGVLGLKKERENKSKMKRNENVKGYLFLIPSFIGISIFTLFPFADAFFRSFKETMNSKFTGFDNYRMVIENKAFSLAAYNTVKFTLICIPLLLIISLILSNIIIKVGKYGEFLKTSYLIPLSIPAASIVLLWRILFHHNGIINGIFYACNIESIEWLNTGHVFGVLVFTYIWKNCGYDMVLWLAGLSNIDKSIYEAADIDGCGIMQKFVYITLPNMKVIIFTVSALSIINSFKVFREAYLICGDYPDNSIYMLQHLFNNWFINLDVQKMSAAAMIMTAVILILMLTMQYLSERE